MLEVYVYFQSHGLLYSSHLNTYVFFFVTIDTFWFLNDVKKVQVISIWNILCFTDPVSYFSFFFPSFPYIYT